MVRIMTRMRIIGIVVILISVFAIGPHITSCGGAASDGVTAPDAATIRTALGLNNPFGMVPGLALGAITMPECVVASASTVLVYAMTGLPTWLAFDGTTRALTLAGGLNVVPAEALTAAEVSYTCGSSTDVTAGITNKATSSGSVTLVINDLDGGGATDGFEYGFGEVPLANNSLGWIWLDSGNVDLYRTPAASARKIPTGIMVTSVGMDPTDPTDDAGDFDGDGVANDVDPNPFVASSTGEFDPPATYETVGGNTIDGITSADFNGDGITDIITTQRSGDNFSVFIGAGDGTLNVPTGFAGLANNTSIVTADFDGDGDYDVAVIASNQVKININDGSGSFTAGEIKTVQNASTKITGADFNGDGVVDLAVTNEGAGNAISLLLGKGDGTFENDAPIPAGGITNGFTAADFDGDGNMDMAATADNTILLFMGNGDGSFAAATTLTLAGNLWRVAAADFDGDGDIDLATSDSDNALVRILLNDGSGSLTETSTPSVGTSPRGLVAADFDGDGIVDLAVTNAADNNISILLGDGDGTFAAAINYAIDTSGGASFPNVLTAADLDGDGDLDIVTGPGAGASELVQVFIN